MKVFCYILRYAMVTSVFIYINILKRKIQDDSIRIEGKRNYSKSDLTLYYFYINYSFIHINVTKRTVPFIPKKIKVIQTTNFFYSFLFR